MPFWVIYTAGRLLTDLRKLALNLRLNLAILSTAIVSIAGLLLTVTVARSASMYEFGQFALAMVVYSLVVGVLRAGIVDTTLAQRPDINVRNSGFRRANASSMLMGVLVLLAGILTSNSYMMLLSVALNGLVILDYIRTTSSALFRPQSNWIISVAWSTLVIVVATASLIVTWSPWVAFVAWGIGGAALGYGAAFRLHYPWRPGWPRDRQSTRAAGLFSLDYLVGSGSAALTTAILGAFLGPPIVGALRGAGTLLGPASLVASTCRSLAIPFLLRARGRGAAESLTTERGFRLERKAALSVTAALTALAIPLVILVLLIPDALGIALLGDTWNLAQLVLLPMAIEVVGQLLGSVPSAGHRAAFAGRRALTLRVAVGVPRPIIVLLAAYRFGAPGAAWAMAAIAFVNAALWWSSYLRLKPSDSIK